MTKANIATSNVGIDRMHRLRMWAASTTAALGGCTAYLGGSAMRAKNWRDLDIYLVFTEERWNAVSAPGLFSNDAWWAMCAAYSAHATAVVGGTVEVHFMAAPTFDVPDYQRVDLATMR